MVRTHWIAASAVLSMAGLPAGSGTVQTAQSQPPAGQGVMCSVMIYNIVAEIGQRCHPDKLPAFQAELRQSIAALDAYVLANSDLTPEALARMKADQSGADMSDEEFCAVDSFGDMYTDADLDEADAIVSMRAEVAAMTARPGTPTWDPCV